MDLLAMRTEVRDIVGELVADFWTDAELNRYITEAQFKFLGEAQWPWLVTASTLSFTGGTPTASFAESVEPQNIIAVSLEKVGDTRRYALQRVSPAKGFELQNRYSTATTSSYPGWWYASAVADADSDNLYIYTVTLIPTPTSNMTFRFLYLRDGVVLSGDTVEPDLPVEFHKALVHYAAGTAWLKELNGGPKAQEQFDLYNLTVVQAKREFFADNNDQPLVMGKNEPQYEIGRPPQDPWLMRMPETL